MTDDDLDDLQNQWRTARREALALLRETKDVVERASAHTEFMNECIPHMINDNGADQQQAIAACLTMWEQQWEATHPGGEVDPSRADREDTGR